ncbi:similar to Saccharomyces cerevisiae YOR089C VPS21 Rab family GTPase required for endocytic transport and for sorting of vacuolar hydrolases [Maudiozyma barnettii]|uniref:Similar to Saccharomyces cerevisiae YOR089C VPS21 Rab family GTPase required for endocytic transport and for sorting of vacuolar hydrolases n=1 Tax=Maudiozyma barnettii TaxID=61262 RepID=A0A8H2ZGF3_9SACH|nr:uncharacterized protein KABA2_04S08712 [Kazachstania barnettii]CAB4254544.1 similar to Saccharomyces cerevisiae YOR089C VPS21 Rab family GTPase required for endocytic transport and for sorting of vacuolar hydrolases [Kazachstania barnettii]CAD1782586.1 similar to Saccharomyces cerevisiae YOR089C VPS21 Rab family GTPase required for endocytic transport and for sorting of vacuolar hydrolases [Kazachstania barnettii]
MTNPIENRNGKKHCNLKVVLLGDSSVGKSSLLMRYIVGKFQTSNATIGAAFMTKNIQLDDEKDVTLEIWDTAGQERYRSLTPMYYRGTDVAIIVYDVTSPISLSHAENWIDELNSYIDTDRKLSSLRIILAANKADLLDEYQQPEELKESRSDKFFVVSAKTGDGIYELFDGAISDLPEEMFIKQSETVDNKIIPIDKKFYDIDISSCNC